jgi:hypothetical protein
VAAWVPDMFFNVYSVKNCKLANNSTVLKARGENKHKFGINKILEVF